jgi:hypothetical protein
MASINGEESETQLPNRTGEGDHGSVSFTIPIELPPKRPRSSPPKRLTNHTKKTLTKEELEEKLKEADERRKVGISRQFLAECVALTAVQSIEF